MKKSSKPSIKSPAPATASPAPLPKLASKPATKISAEPAPAAAAPAAAPKPAPRAFASSAPAPKAPAVPVSRIAPVLAAPRPAAASLTVINAKVDVGFGNSLFVRGEGPGLSWSKGLPMTNVGSELWTLSLARSAKPVVFKFLLNDETWSSGADYQAESGTELTVSPAF